MNPYWGKDFFSFLALFFQRMVKLCIGELSFAQLASDEIQILVLCCVGVSSVFVGAFLVLKKMTMLANALSHTILLGLVLSYLGMQWIAQGELLEFKTQLLLIASVVAALLTMILTDVCKRVFKLQEDASIGLVFTFLFALGIILVTLYTHHVHLGVEAIMGNIDALHIDDLKFAFLISIGNVIAVLLFFKYYQIFAFDEVTARLLGCIPLFFQYLLILQTSLTAIGAFRAVGVFLFLIFLTAPILSARLLTKTLKHLIGYGIMIHIVSILVAVALSRHLLSVYEISLSTAGLTCLCSALSYPICLFVKHIQYTVDQSLKKRTIVYRQIKKHMNPSQEGKP
jgi:manganese/zinc/iron transport system permease protein